MDLDDATQRESMLQRAVLAGDESAWQTLYERNFDELFRYVNWRCAGAGPLVEEIMQEAWLTAVRRIRKFDARRGTFANWIRGIAANVLRNEFRHRRTRSGVMAGFDVDRAISQPPESALENREQAEHIAAALAALPQHYEQVLRAKYVDALPVAQIAEGLQQTPKAVESLLTRARDAFRRECLRHEDLTG